MERRNATPSPLSGIGTTLKGNVATTKKLLDDLVDAQLMPMGLTIGEADVLTLVLIAGPDRVRPKQLAEWLSVTTAGMTGRLNSLERKGLIQRVPDANDGRSVSVELTLAGSERAEAVVAVKDEAWSQPVLDALGASKATELNAALEQLNDALRSLISPA